VVTDASRRREVHPRRVSTVERVRAVIEIERGERTISGQLAIDDAPSTRFFGWLELIDLLERATTRPVDPPSGASDVEQGPL
jgi:hypothetical protein